MTARRSLAEMLAAAEEIRAGAAAQDAWLAELRLAGLGWASVELERGAEELFEMLTGAGLPEPDWAPAPRDAVLGATAWVASAEGGRPAIVLLEPDTEGRLAATLARFGEGVAAVYLEAPVGGAAESSGQWRRGAPPWTSEGELRMSPDSGRLGRSSPGPLGPSRIILAGRTWGPHVIVLERSTSAPHG